VNPSGEINAPWLETDQNSIAEIVVIFNQLMAKPINGNSQ
jgi:hypothetical protein